MRLAAALVALAVLAAPGTAQAQRPAKVWKIGILHLSTREAAAPLTTTFSDGLRALGYVEGRNVVMERRYADGRLDRLPDLAAELVRARVDVITASANAAIVAVKGATTTIPIVMVHSEDPVGAGLVASLVRPGGNITGQSIAASTETIGKRLEMLKQIVPKLSLVAILHQVGAGSGSERAAIETAARTLGIALEFIEIADPDEVEPAFATMTRRRAGAFLIQGGPLTWMRRQQIADLALAQRLPGIHTLVEYARAGLLITYGPNLPEFYRQAAVYVDKILKGAQPRDLPVAQPTKFQLVINLRTAKALGLTIPQALLLQADEIIQ